MRIGEAATELGVGTHVLRHWEQVGALPVDRDARGSRTYDRAALDRARTVRKLRRAGLSLPEIIAAMAPAKVRAQEAVRTRIALLEAEIRHRQQAVTFLRHTAECRHRYLDECPECTDFVHEDGP